MEKALVARNKNLSKWTGLLSRFRETHFYPMEYLNIVHFKIGLHSSCCACLLLVKQTFKVTWVCIIISSAVIRREWDCFIDHSDYLIKLSIKIFLKVPLVEVKLNCSYDPLFKVKPLYRNKTNLQGQLKVNANSDHMGYRYMSFKIDILFLHIHSH